MVLSARVEASADFDAQILHRLGELHVPFRQLTAQLGGESAGRGDAQFASVGSWARGDIDNGSGPLLMQPELCQFRVEVR